MSRIKPTEAMLNQAPWMRTAINYLGVTEIPGSKHNQVIIGFYAKAKNPQIKNDETAWCSAFANAVMFENNIPGTANLMAKSWLNWKNGERVVVPRYGDIVVFDRGSDPAFGHVAFFEGWDDDYVYVLGGNQGKVGGVTRSAYPRKKLRGFRRPKRTGIPTVPVMSQRDKPKVTVTEIGTGVGSAVVASKSASNGDWLFSAVILLTILSVAGYLIWKRRGA